MDAIMTAMQYRKGSLPASFNILSGEKASASSIANIIENYMPIKTKPELEHSNTTIEDEKGKPNRPPHSDMTREHLNFEPKVFLRDGIAKLLAWHLNQHLPHGSWSPHVNDDIGSDKSKSSGDELQKVQDFHVSAIESGHQFLDREQIPLSEDDNYHLRGYKVLPCSSECSDPSMCRASAFDEAAIKSRKMTQNCERVLYTSLLGKDIDAIHIKAPDSSNDDLCKIAFVSKHSKLVKKNFEKNLHNGWSIVQVDFEDNAILPEHKWLPKLSPGKLFHSRVRYAIYVHDDLPMSPSLDDMLFIIDLMTWEKIGSLGQVEKTKESMVLLSALELKSSASENIDKKEQNSIMTVVEAKERILEYRQVNQHEEKKVIQRRISLSQQAIIILNRCEFSTSCHKILKYKLRYWTKTKWVVHNLQLPGAKDFRCEWYKEHTKFDDEFDEFSFAHVMAMKEIEHFLSLDEDAQIQMLERSALGILKEWIPVGNGQNNKDRQDYVHIVDAEGLVEGRREWNQRKQEIKLI